MQSARRVSVMHRVRGLRGRPPCVDDGHGGEQGGPVAHAAPWGQRHAGSGVRGGARRVLMMGTTESRSVSPRVQLHGVSDMQGLGFGEVRAAC